MSVVLAIVASFMAVSIGFAAADSALGTMSEVDSSFDDMGSGGTEWSGATYNADRNALLLVDDETTGYEFDLNFDGSIDRSEPVRTFTLALGEDDIEGIAWMGGETYAFASEGAGEIIVAELGLTATAVTADDVLYSFDATPTSFTANKGLEGIAYGEDHFYVVHEMPAKIARWTTGGVSAGSVQLPQIDDASGVVFVADGTYLVLSHESRVVTHYSIDWANSNALVLAQLQVPSFGQAEGIALNANNDLYVFGEADGQTFAQFEGEVTTVVDAFETHDVNCSGDLNVADAITVVQYGVGTSQISEDCGNGDVNNDGVVNMADALIILQCSVGLTNAYCPAA